MKEFAPSNKQCSKSIFSIADGIKLESDYLIYTLYFLFLFFFLRKDKIKVM